MHPIPGVTDRPFRPNGMEQINIEAGGGKIQIQPS